jgi:hypothetical protein
MLDEVGEQDCPLASLRQKTESRVTSSINLRFILILYFILTLKKATKCNVELKA